MFKKNSPLGIKKESTINYVNLKTFIPQKFIIALEICGLNNKGFCMKICDKVLFIMFPCVKVNRR